MIHRQVISDRRRGFDRVVRIWLPGETPRAVLYLNDGQNLFVDRRSRKAKWRADRTAEELITSGSIVPIAIVGIDHGGGTRRWRDYLPYADPWNRRAREFGADRYVDFVVGTVMRRVERLFPEIRHARHIGFGGSSYGAVAAVHAAVRHPGTFDRLLLESAALWVGDGRLMDEARSLEAERTFIGMGSREWGRDAVRYFARGGGQVGRPIELDQELVRLARTLARGLGSRSKVKLVIGRGATHHETAWAERLPVALRWLFAR